MPSPIPGQSSSELKYTSLSNGNLLCLSLNAGISYFQYLVFILLLATWLMRAQLVERVVPTVMSNAGLTNVSIAIDQLDTDQSKISHLTFSLLIETGLLSIEVFDISINYTPVKLSKGRIDELVIEKLVIDINTDNEHVPNMSVTKISVDDIDKSTKTRNVSHHEKINTQQTYQPLQIIDQLRVALRDYIVFNTLLVKHITLNGEPFGVLHDKIFHLKSQNINQSLSTEFTMLGSLATAQSMRLPQLMSRLTEDSLSAELRLVERRDETFDVIASGMAANIELDFRDAALTGSYNVIPKRLHAWLQPFVDVESLNVIGRIEGQLAFDFSSDRQIVSTLSAKVDRLIFGTYVADNAAIKLKLKIASTDNVINDSGQQIQLLNGSYIKASSFKYADLSLKDSRIYMIGNLTTTTGGWSYEGGLSSKLVAARYDLQSISIKDVAVRIAANAEKLDLSGTFSPATVPAKFSFSLDQNLDENRGKFSIKPIKPLDLNAEDKKLSQLFAPWPYSFDLLSGTIRLTADARWSDSHGSDKDRFKQNAAKQNEPKKSNFNLKVKIELDDAGGNIGEVLFSGLSFRHELDILPKLQSARISEINLSHIDSGVTISNISTHLAVGTTKTGPLPRILVHDLRGDIFGGNFSGNELIYDLNKAKNNLEIEATGIDLAKIIETQQLDGIAASGRVNGVIPVELNEQGLFIENGSFINATNDGTISYNPAAGTDQLKQNVLTGMALDALKDFRYSYLSAGVNFTPDGLLAISLQLKGISPGLDAKRPVHLNINTEQNLLSLLKSLRYAQGVSEKIDKTVRRQYETLKK